MHEAKIDDTPEGRLPADDGWFILNLAEIAWNTIPGLGTWCVFESPNAPSKTLGTPNPTTHYVPNPLAAEYGASVPAPTTRSEEAYRDRPPWQPVRSPWPLTWSRRCSHSAGTRHPAASAGGSRTGT